MTAPADLRGRLVLTVPEAGRLLWGLGRDASYAAAERGEIPSQKVGRRLIVPTHAALRQLGMSDALIARALGLDPEHTEADSSPEPATAYDHHSSAQGAPSHDRHTAPSDQSNVHVLHRE